MTIHFNIDKSLNIFLVSLNMACCRSSQSQRFWGKLSYSHLLVYPKGYAHEYICFGTFILRIHIALMRLTYHFQDWFPCNVEIVSLSNCELSVKHAWRIWANFIVRRQQLNKSTKNKISITYIILSVYCIYIYIYGLPTVYEVPIIWAEYFVSICSDENDVIPFHKMCFNANSETKYTT